MNDLKVRDMAKESVQVKTVSLMQIPDYLLVSTRVYLNLLEVGWALPLY